MTQLGQKSLPTAHQVLKLRSFFLNLPDTSTHFFLDFESKFAGHRYWWTCTFCGSYPVLSDLHSGSEFSFSTKLNETIVGNLDPEHFIFVININNVEGELTGISASTKTMIGVHLGSGLNGTLLGHPETIYFFYEK